MKINVGDPSVLKIMKQMPEGYEPQIGGLITYDNRLNKFVKLWEPGIK